MPRLWVGRQNFMQKKSRAEAGLQEKQSSNLYQVPALHAALFSPFPASKVLPSHPERFRIVTTYRKKENILSVPSKPNKFGSAREFGTAAIEMQQLVLNINFKSR